MILLIFYVERQVTIWITNSKELMKQKKMLIKTWIAVNDWKIDNPYKISYFEQDIGMNIIKYFSGYFHLSHISLTN